MERAALEQDSDDRQVLPWRLVLAAGLAFYLDAAALISVSIALPIWRRVYQLSVWQTGLLSGGMAFALAAGSLAGGWLGDRYGRSRVFTLDLVCFCAGTVVVLTASDVIQLTCGVLVVGLAAGADVPTALAVIADVVPPATRGRSTGATQLLWIAAVLATLALGYAVSGLGFLGTQLLMGHLVALAALTLGLRLTLVAWGNPISTPQPGLGTARASSSPGRLLEVESRVPLLLTTTFYLCWNVASGTLGSYGTYFLVVVTGLSQTTATALALAAFLPALVMVVVFVRLADTRWRDRLFVVAMFVQVVAFGVGAATGGRVLAGMVILIVLYSLSNVFAGEAIYKVWSQLLFPDGVRSTAIGVSYGVARAVTAALLLFVPPLVASSPTLVLWLLTLCVATSGGIGMVLVHHPSFTRLLHPDTRSSRTRCAEQPVPGLVLRSRSGMRVESEPESTEW